MWRRQAAAAAASPTLVWIPHEISCTAQVPAALRMPPPPTPTLPTHPTPSPHVFRGPQYVLSDVIGGAFLRHPFIRFTMWEVAPQLDPGACACGTGLVKAGQPAC